WKVNNPQLGTYFMTLNADGSGSSNLTGGELGRWEWKADHIDLEWTPKKMTFYFDSGSSKPQDQPSRQPTEKSTAEKIDDVPMD
ncbi:MAG TPA: hypothetical protein VFW62_08570, partial [bacterium]|nr:hypothetical protein [bacterium]